MLLALACAPELAAQAGKEIGFSAGLNSIRALDEKLSPLVYSGNSLAGEAFYYSRNSKLEQRANVRFSMGSLESAISGQITEDAHTADALLGEIEHFVRWKLPVGLPEKWRACLGYRWNFTAFRRYKYRTSPEHDEFSGWIEDFISPAGPRQFTGPVFVLTNRGSFSAAEDFVLAMRQFPHVQTLGDTTGGGTGNPVFRELPNGWAYRFSTWVMEGPNGFNFEGAGIPPDHLVNISRQDSLAMRDMILEKAIELAQ